MKVEFRSPILDDADVIFLDHYSNWSHIISFMVQTDIRPVNSMQPIWIDLHINILHEFRSLRIVIPMEMRVGSQIRQMVIVQFVT